MSYALRWREPSDQGKTVQRTIYLGCNPERIQKARELLARWQEVHDPRRTLDPHMRAVVEDVQLFSLCFKGKERRHFVKHHLAAGLDLRKFMSAVSSWQRQTLLRSALRRGGRPCKGRLAWCNDLD